MEHAAPSHTPSLTESRAPARWWPFALLLLLLGGMLLLLLVRGLDLGFTGDLLDYAYHYERFGTFGGMHWLVTEHLQRHLFAPLFSAPLAYLFPDQSAAWYAYAFFAHFASAAMVYVLANAVLRGQYRWASFSAALLFAFHALQARLNFEFPTSGHGNSALFFSLLSLWLYLQYVRRGRNRWWLELSLVAYIFAIGIYEQTVLFFLLHPLIAYSEDRQHGKIENVPRWLFRVALDSIWFPVFVVVYLFLLRVLFLAEDHLVLSPLYLLQQVLSGFFLFTPGNLLALSAAQTSTLIVTLLITAALAALLAGWIRQETSARADKDSHSQDNKLVYLAVFGFGLMVVSILGVAPTQWRIPEHPRMIYPSGVGFGFLVAGLGALIVTRSRSSRFAFGIVVGLLVASGVTRFLQFQDEYAAQNVVRQRALAAIHEAAPNLSGEQSPYLLLYSDANPTTDLWLYAQDNRFPLMIDRLYDTTGIHADALYFGLDESLAPAPDMPGSAYNGQFIVVEPEGIYSPLKPYEPIDPSRLVIVYYDSGAGEARVVDQLPPDVIEHANIVERAEIDWATNPDLLALTAP